MNYRVMKPIATSDGLLPTGSLVDASGWRNLRALINNRHLVEVSESVSPTVSATKTAKSHTKTDK